MSILTYLSNDDQWGIILYHCGCSLSNLCKKEKKPSFCTCVVERVLQISLVLGKKDLTSRLSATRLSPFFRNPSFNILSFTHSKCSVSGGEKNSHFCTFCLIEFCCSLFHSHLPRSSCSVKVQNDGNSEWKQYELEGPPRNELRRFWKLCLLVPNTRLDLLLSYRAFSLKNQLWCGWSEILWAGSIEKGQEEMQRGEPTREPVWLGNWRESAAVEAPASWEYGVSAPCRDPQTRETEEGKGAGIALGGGNQWWFSPPGRLSTISDKELFLCYNTNLGNLPWSVTVGGAMWQNSGPAEGSRGSTWHWIWGTV